MKFGLNSLFDREPPILIGDVVVVVWLIMACVGLFVMGWL